MTKDDIRLLYEYDRWANRRVLKAASTLSQQQFTRAIGGSFHCVRDTLLHILSGDWIWLAYWGNPPDSTAALSDLKAKRDALFSPEAFPNVDALQSKWIEVELEQWDFVNRLDNESLAKLLPFRGTRLTLMHLMQHGQSLHLPSRSSGAHDAAAWCSASRDGFPRISSGTSRRVGDCTINTSLPRVVLSIRIELDD